MFGWEFPPHIAGGLGTACYGMTRGLARNDVNVTFVMPRATGDEDQNYVRVVNASDVETLFGGASGDTEELWKKMSFIHIDSNMVPYVSPEEYKSYHDEYVRTGRKTRETTDLWKQRYTFSGKYGANLMEEVARYAMVAAQVARDLAGQFDVIHAHDWLTYYAGIAAKRVSGKPLVVHMHATEYDRSGENVNTQVYAIERAGMHAADRVIAVSNLTRNIIVSRYGIPAEKVVTVHNAVRFAEAECAAPERGVGDKIVTFLGRITYQKGPDYFVEAAAKVLKRVPNVRFVMAGSGDMMNHVIRRVARLGIADRFHFTGFLRGEDVHRMFQLSDVYVMPSVSEPFGISPLEAMRSNVPVIISKQSGVAEVLDYALKVDYWDVDALSDACLLYTSDAADEDVRREGARRGDRTQMGQRCREDQGGLSGGHRRGGRTPTGITTQTTYHHENDLFLFSGSSALAAENLPVFQYGRGSQLPRRSDQPRHPAKSGAAVLPADERPAAEPHQGAEGQIPLLVLDHGVGRRTVPSLCARSARLVPRTGCHGMRGVPGRDLLPLAGITPLEGGFRGAGETPYGPRAQGVRDETHGLSLIHI